MKKNNKITTEEFKQKVYNLVKDEYTVLGKYINNKTKIKIRHNCENCNNYEYEVRPSDFLKENGNRCPKCAKINNRKSTELFKNQVYDLVKDEYTVLGKYINRETPIRIRHNCNNCNNYEWDANPKWFLKGTRCPKCQHGSKRKTTEEFKQEIFKLVGTEYELIGEYNTCHTKVKLKHTICGNEYLVQPSVFLDGRRCPFCANKNLESKNIIFIKNILNAKNIQFIQEYKFNDLVNLKNIPFSFDFYIPSINSLIEYDGEQHFKAFGFNNDDSAKKLNRLRETDLIRNNYCINKKIRLFRLSYKLSQEEIEKAIDEILIFDESSTTIENNKIYYSDINGNKYNYNNYYE